MRKTISLILSVLMILSSFSVITTISAKETNVVPTGATYSGTTGDCTWSFDEDTETLTISGNGDMGDYYDWSDDYVPWSKFSSVIKTVVIEDGVTSIASNAFNDCSNLTSVTIPDSVTSIGDDAFYGCSNLTSITIPDSVTSIGFRAFENCSNLTSITIPDSVTSIGGYAFDDTGYYNDENNWDNGVLYLNNYLINAKGYIEKCVIKDGTKLIGYGAFENCSNLTSITIPDSVTSIDDYTFENCSNLTSITIPDSVTSIGFRAFENCSNLTSITIPDSVTSIGGYAFDDTGYYNDENNWDNGVLYLNNYLINAKGYIEKCVIKDGTKLIGDDAFSDCSSLTSITIPDSVTSIGFGAFSGCSSLTSITIPDSVTSIDNYTFYYCSSLTSITIPKSIISIGEFAFYGCSSLTNVYYGGNKRQFYEINIGFYNLSVTNATLHCSITTDSGTAGNCTWTFDESTGILTISGNGKMDNYEDYAPSPWYAYSSVIKTVVIEDGVTSIGAYAFCNCSSLASISIANSVTSIDVGAFKKCSSLTSITIPDSVTSIGEDTFKDCSSLISITIPDSVTSIGYYAFGECSSLTSITIPNSIKTIGRYAFYDCSSLTNVYYGGNRRQFYKINIEGANQSLTEAKLHYSITTDSGTAGNCTWTFDESTGILTISGNDKMDNYEDYAPSPWYAYSSVIKTVVIEDGVTSIGAYAFCNCSSLASISIANSVTLIRDYAFSDCSNLKDVYYDGTATQWHSINPYYNNGKLLEVNIHFLQKEPTTKKPTVKKVTKVSLSKKSVVLVKGRSTTVKATVTPTNATNKKLKWTTSNAKVATVNQSGKITAKGRGNATIKVMALDGSNKYATVKVTVKQPVTSVKLNRNSAILKVKGKAKQKTVTLKATVYPKNANNKAVSWKSSNSKITTVNRKGKVTAKKRGTCYITATAKDGSKKSAKCKIVVK